GSNSITGVSPASALTTPTQSVGIGQSIIGAGIPTGTIITAINGTTLTLSNKANALASATQPEPLWPGSVAQSVTGTVTKGSTTISAMSSTAGLVPGQSLIGLGIPTGSTIATVINGSSVTISQPATATTAATPLYQPDTGQPISGITGNLSCSGATNTVSNVSSTTSMASGQSISNPNIEIGTKIAGLPSTTTLTLSQAPLAALTNANLVVGAEPRLTSLAITGSTDGSTATLTGLSPSALPAVGQAVSGQGIPAGTVITAVDGTPSLTLSLPVLSPGNNLPLTGSFNGCVNPTGTVSAATPTKVTNLNCIAGLAVGQSISSGNNFHSGTTIQAITVGPATLSQTTSSAQSGTNLFTTYPSCPGPTKTYSGAYSGWMSGGLYQAPVAYPATSTAPSVQHPSAAAANIAAAGGSPAQMASQIWPQPGTAGTGLSSANSNRGALQGNYLDQRDNQFNNIQFIDDLGNPFFVNIVVYQALPYIYANNNSIYQYCMLFEGMKGCYRDVYTSDCTFQGNDEWGNPPVAVTADCNQHPW
ncbi:MAG TPA: hypothetical protein HPP80_09995, partial [Rhodospirillaceae bacterium]|nr:hypothetical protein [Rhodospirillaceae bacterium]